MDDPWSALRPEGICYPGTELVVWRKLVHRIVQTFPMLTHFFVQYEKVTPKCLAKAGPLGRARRQPQRSETLILA